MNKQNSKHQIPNTKNKKGITLIALIITIVILLILAAVAIGAVKDSNIIAHAQNTASGYNKTKIEEEALLADYEKVLNKQVLGEWGGRGLTLAKLDTPYNGNITVAGSTETVTLTIEYSGGLKLNMNGNEAVLTPEDAKEYYNEGDLQIIGNDTLVIGEMQFKFIKNGEEAEYISSAGKTLGILYVDEPLNSYLYYLLSAQDIPNSDNPVGIFIDTYYSIELWLGSSEEADLPWVVGTGNVAPQTIQKADGTSEYQERVVSATMIGTSEAVILGYLTENDELVVLESNLIKNNRRLISESINFTSIYDTEDTNELGMKISYGLVQDTDSTSAGICYTMIRYKEKYDCASTVPTRYKIEEGVIYLEKLKDSGEGTGTYEAMSSTAQLRQ